MLHVPIKRQILDSWYGEHTIQWIPMCGIMYEVAKTISLVPKCHNKHTPGVTMQMYHLFNNGTQIFGGHFPRIAWESTIYYINDNRLDTAMHILLISIQVQNLYEKMINEIFTTWNVLREQRFTNDNIIHYNVYYAWWSVNRIVLNRWWKLRKAWHDTKHNWWQFMKHPFITILAIPPFSSTGLFVCMFVTNITYPVMNALWWNFHQLDFIVLLSNHGNFIQAAYNILVLLLADRQTKKPTNKITNAGKHTASCTMVMDDKHTHTIRAWT